MTKTHSEFDRYAASYTDLHRSSIKASGEEPSYFSSYKAKYVASHTARAEENICILDFGCGVGNSLSHLHNEFPSATLHGADLSAESIALAEESHSEFAKFCVIDEGSLPYADASFDVIFVACVFHHIPPAERSHWMQELRRVLRPSGQVFVFEHNVLNPLTLKAVNDCPFDEDAILLPRRELLMLAKTAGFGNVRANYIVFFPHALAGMRPLERFMHWLPLGAQYVVQAIA
jgi:SAM-dependent methyltransferase